MQENKVQRELNPILAGERVLVLGGGAGVCAVKKIRLTDKIVIFVVLFHWGLVKPNIFFAQEKNLYLLFQKSYSA